MVIACSYISLVSMAMFTANSSLRKSLSKRAFHQQTFATGYSVPTSFTHLPDFQTSAFPYLQPTVSVLNTNGVRHCEQNQLAQNGGNSLVLDNRRGELVNASKMTLKEILEAKALAASKNHSEAERRRRQRINSHLATLRNLLPSGTKTDKASLLAEVIDHVKDLKRRASEIAQVGPIPTDVDELKVEADGAIEEGKIFIKASLCCDDRPDLMSDLIQTFQTLGLRTVKAEMSTLAGRVKNVFLVTDNEKVFEEIQTKPSINSIEEALKAVMERTAASGELSAGSSISNKRQRILPFEA